MAFATLAFSAPNEESSTTVWLSVPEMQAHDWKAENQPWLRQEGQRRQAQWLSGHHERVSYTIAQRTYGLSEDDPCNRLPVRLQIRGSTIVKATYAATADARCKRGSVVDPRVYEFRLLTPDELFHLVDAAANGDPVPSNNCLEARFDESTGLPIKLFRGCTWVSDGGWAARITEIDVR